MTIFDFNDQDSFGAVISVDTSTVIVRVDDLERLKRIQVNRLVALQCCRPGQHLIGLITRITRKAENDISGDDSDNELEIIKLPENNLAKISLIGTFFDRDGAKENVFRRTIDTVPEIDAYCFALEDSYLTSFMQAISNIDIDGPKLALGKYTLDDGAEAYLNGNKLFQRHAIVVGGTGSGKSYTTARILDQIAQLDQANVILFDIHGEYKPLIGDEFRHLKIAGPADVDAGKGIADNVLHLPYWLFGYEALLALFVDRSDANAPNQSMIISKLVTDAKRELLSSDEHADILSNFTIESPVPFDLSKVFSELERLNTEMVPGSGNREKQGPYFDKLSRLIARLDAKSNDRRLGFIFQAPEECMGMDWLAEMIKLLLAGRGTQKDKLGGIKIIDFSEVPSDILPLMVSLLARVVFITNQWLTSDQRHPIALMCDEAHLYIPERSGIDSAGAVSVCIFERIAKEGRKYGVGLVVISQRPAEVNRTVLSQCNNVIAMRLTNGDDQSVIRRLLPDSLGSFGDLLPILDVGEALVVGDASLLPTRIRVAEPKRKPSSETIPFWTNWSEAAPKSDLKKAVRRWRRQSFQD
ncbi:ATP-binding protein [Hyphococcus sp.]|uniref:ATP-binding protein n=1 Tax=Hyphococcus sp. TaxID=2038636 RepID=UPI002089B1BF|nr:MAG: sea9 [Marinicaulis sp.]